MYCPHSSPGCEQRKELGRKQINPSPSHLWPVFQQQEQLQPHFQGQASTQPLLGHSPPCATSLHPTNPCTQSCAHLMGPGAAGRAVTGPGRFCTQLEGSLGINPALGEELSLFSQMGLCRMTLWTPSTTLPQGLPTSPKPRMLLLGGHQGLICDHSSTGRAALEACMAQEVQGSESWTAPNPDGERWPHEWRKLFTAWNCEQHRLHALSLQLASLNTEWLVCFFSRPQTGILGIISVCAPDPRGESLLLDVWNIS